MKISTKQFSQKASTLARNIVTLAVITIAVASRADIIVHWGESNDIVGTTTSMIEGQNDSVLNLGAPSSPTVGASYYKVTTDRSPLYFANASTGGSIDRYQVNDANSDTIVVRNRGNGTEVDVLMVWTQTGNGVSYGFLNGADDVANVETLDLTQLTVEADLQSSSNKRFSWVIQLDNGNWYVSENIGNLGLRGFVPFTTDPTTVIW